MPARFADIMNETVSPRVLEWHRRMMARPAVAAALAMPAPRRGNT
jgi:glutathione S-transferase